MDPSLIFKALSSLAGPLSKKALSSRPVVRYRTVRHAHREAAARGINIDKAALSRWLTSAETQKMILSRDLDDVTSLVDSLGSSVLSRVTPWRDHAEDLLLIVIQSLINVIGVDSAVAAANTMQLIEHRETRKQADEQSRQILAKLDVAVSRPVNLESIPALLRPDFMAAISAWAEFGRILADPFIESEDRGALLNQWFVAPPAALSEASANIFTLLARLADAYGKTQAAEAWFKEAIDLGAYPQDFWQARLQYTVAQHSPSLVRDFYEANPPELPFAKALNAAINDDYDSCLLALDEWSSKDPEQVVTREIMRTQCFAAQKDYSKAIASSKTVARATETTSALLLAAQYLIVRATIRETVNSLTDTREALALALEVRDARRTLRLDTTDSVVLAARAAHLSHLSDKAWEITRPPPDGEANTSEAEEEAVLAQASLAAAVTGRPDAARELASKSGQPFVVLQVEAIIDEFRGDRTSAASNWREAWATSSDDSERIQAARGLAELGEPMPDLSQINGYDSAISEIIDIARVMSHPRRLEQLRTSAHQSPLMAIKLSEELESLGKIDEAAESLYRAASTWKDPYLALMSASRFKNAGLPEKAEAAARLSITLAPADWGDRRSALGFMLELATTQGAWDRAVLVASELVDSDPGSPSALWALTRCQLQRGDVAGAWSTFNSLGQPLHPRDTDEALVWLGLYSRYAGKRVFAAEALKLMGDYQEDEKVMAAFLAAMLDGSNDTDPDSALDESVVVEIQKATANFLEKFPESSFFRTIQLGPEDDPLLPLHDILRQKYEALLPLHKAVINGEAPLGIISSVQDIPYTQLIVARAANSQLAFASVASQAERDSAKLSITTGEVYIDQSAAHTLAVLSDESSRQLRGAFSRLISTDEALRDALSARDATTQRTSGSIVWDPTTGSPMATAGDPEVAEREGRQASRIVNILAAIERHPRPEIAAIPASHPLTELPNRTRWLSVLDLALARRGTFWCDDISLRALAASWGVQTFSTAVLVDVMRVSGRVTEQEQEVFLASCVAAHYAHIPFTAAVYELARGLDGGRPGGASASLSRPSTWSDTGATAQFALSSIRACTDNPDDVAVWAENTFTGLIAIAGTTDAAVKNGEVFLGRLISEPWCSAEVFAFSLAGARNAAARSDIAIADVASAVFSEYYEALIAATGNHETAALALLDSVRLCPDSIRALATRVILLHD